MTAEPQGRIPAGAPAGAGGQFEPKANSEPEATLAEANSTQGSFLFPPINYGPNGTDSYFAFWESTPISDRVLSNLVTMYRHNREAWIGAHLNDWAEDFGNDPVNVGRWASKHVTQDDILAEHEAARAARLAELEAARPITTIHPSEARGIAVAAQMWKHAGSFTPEEQAVIDNHPVVVARGREPLTVKEIWETYHLDEVIDTAFVDQDVAVQHELAELRRHIGAYTTNE